MQYLFVRHILFFAFFGLGISPVYAIVCSSFVKLNNVPDSNQSVYSVKYWFDLPLTALGTTTNIIGLQRIKKNSRLDNPDEVANLNAADINSFDRSATRQDPEFAKTADVISDWGMNISIALPVLLLADKNMRKDWKEILLIYAEAGIVFANAYSWGGGQFVKRYRPFLYNKKVPDDEKTGNFRSNSFFSGHTSTSATATFFMAKVYSDYYPNKNKFVTYGLAAIPPALVGYFRYKAGKHYPSDIIVGFAVGAVGGILIPHLHKKLKKQKENSWSLAPVTGDTNGIQVKFTF